MRYFVTGATSLIGRAVTQRLVAAGHEVITVSRKPDRAIEELDMGVEVLYGDIIWKKTLNEAFEGIDGVFHMNSYFHYKTKDARPSQGTALKISKNIKETVKELREARDEAKQSGMTVAERINVEGTRNVLELVKERKIRKAVFTSTLSVFGDTRGRFVNEKTICKGPWNSEYEKTMWRAQFEVAIPMMQKGLPLVVLQPGLVYGPSDTGYVHYLIYNHIRRMLKNPQDGLIRSYPAGTGYSWTYIDDVADAHIAAMQHGKVGETYILAGPAHSVASMFEMIEKITGLAKPRFCMKPAVLKINSAFMQMIGAFVPLSEQFSAEAIRSIAGTTCLGGSDKAAAELGFSAIPLYQGLKRTLYYEMSELGLIIHEQADGDIEVVEAEVDSL